jgi:putative addiction module killer protein
MLEILRTREFADWFRALRDQTGRAKIQIRIDRLAMGNSGNVAPVGEGVSELRIDYGPGYRIYYTLHERTVILLLCGGDKDSQGKDVAKAKRLAKEYQE